MVYKLSFWEILRRFTWTGVFILGMVNSGYFTRFFIDFFKNFWKYNLIFLFFGCREKSIIFVYWEYFFFFIKYFEVRLIL